MVKKEDLPCVPLTACTRILIMADKHEIDGVRKEKERLTAAQILKLIFSKLCSFGILRSGDLMAGPSKQDS